MVLARNWAEVVAADLLEHLRSRTMAGLPHVGILGPKSIEISQGSDEPSDIEEDEPLVQSGTDDADPDFPDWKFVPNKMAYQITVVPTDKTPLITEISFYVRIKEGCDGDVGTQLEDRPAEYTLNMQELVAAFRHYKIVISNYPSFEKDPDINLFVDGHIVNIQNDRIETHTTTTVSSQSSTLKIIDESEPFLVYQEGKKNLSKQQYTIQIKKDLMFKDGKILVNVEIKNLSERTQQSSIPERQMDKKSGRIDDESECLARISEEIGKNPFWQGYKPRFFKIPNLKNSPSGNRYGYLMEFESSEIIRSIEYPFTEQNAARTVNAVLNDSGLVNSNGKFIGKISFRDNTTFLEEVPSMAPGAKVDDLFSELRINDNLKYSLRGVETLYKFQETSIRKLMLALRDISKNTTALLSARTAGGKTEAFLIPVLQFCLENGEKGVKALIFYPTKALANDQANRYIDILYLLNKRIKDRRRQITIGLLHGDISKFEPEAAVENDWDLPLACPSCQNGTLKVIDEGLRCNLCGELLDFVKISNRQETYADPPDILITNPDTLIWDLMLRPQNHSIFGRKVQVCRACNYTYVKVTKRKCANEKCKSTDLEVIHPTVPSIIVFDEIHLFKGTFGINCSYFLSRLESIIRKYSSTYRNQENPKIVRIGATATILNPKEFVRHFFNCKDEDTIHIPEDDRERDSFYEVDKTDKAVHRHHVYIMPYAYNTDSTVGRTIHYLEARSKLGRMPTLMGQHQTDLWDEYLQTICFVNSIRSSNNLIALTRRTLLEELPDLQIDGHTTDFDKKQRGRIERAFNRRDLHIIFATQTLEVGIDFRKVHVVIVNGFPFSFNDYLQRIGRGGRKSDSLIVTVCQNWKPIDHYYYSNAKAALKNPTMHMEPVPITRYNIEAIKKHARGAALDFIVSREDMVDYVADFRKFRDIGRLSGEVIQYCMQAFGLRQSFRQDIEQTVINFFNYLEILSNNEIESKNLFSKYKEAIRDRYQLTSLRSTDREVTVEVMWTT